MIPGLCCSFFTLALSARCSPLAACHCCSHASTAIEVTKLLQEINPVASQPPTSPPKVIPKLCCCFFTHALSARCSHLAACCCCSHASTAIEVTKLWQNITLVASKPPTSPPKVIPELCCCFFTRALSGRCSPLVACCLSQLGAAQIVIGCHRLQRAQDNKGMPTLATAASAPRMQCLCRLTLCSVGRCCLWQTGGG